MSKHLFSSSILSRSLVPASPSSSCMSSRVIQRLTASQLRCNSSSGLSERNIDIALDEIQYSKPLDEKDRRRIKTLLTLEKPWQITKDNRGLEKAFRFSTFKSAMVRAFVPRLLFLTAPHLSFFSDTCMMISAQLHQLIF